ncbi:helix-turn-helix transcriptional regulator [Methanimicrococcus blatticola]|uniref:Putative transcriptional regulator n=1 Tax=Methanimicrococcus blatticola TaxID=91560 RepID=A0A484F525_9EURY|nr:winged helix-turn-helix domain-containing protein [Methanimicrococcus blatticola]MBZ3935844.1 winged helix-turn-helix domain-containing protein [Methanimicrococcus blatticola]MCC2508035.1 winged helix-turn-helix domain-containing protein [Methanimicrococcus blatticola]TDQ68882.1 putative transcriptional regulator [Methanimicrococcus blatticola]
MKSCLIDTIFLSDKRKNLLLLLLEGPQTSDDIKDKLNVNWGAMIPQIKKLEEWDLITSKDRVYYLTDMGRAIANNSKQLLNILCVYENNQKYWATHDLSRIPTDLLDRIGELGPCKLLESDLAHVFDANKDVVEAMIDATFCGTLSNFFQPQYNKMYNTMIKNGCDLTLIYSQSVFDRILSEYVYDGTAELDDVKFLDWKNTKFYVIPDGLGITEISVTNNIVLLGLFDSDNRFDSRYILSSGDRSHQWGMELFAFLSKEAKRIETNVKD